MNEAQINYLAAKAAFLTIEDEMLKKEREFLKGKGYTDTRIYMIEDEVNFNLLNEEFAFLAKGTWNRLVAADKALKDAEEALLGYAFSIFPENIREILRFQCRETAFRKQLIDDVMRLDTRTVPGAARY